MQIKNRLSRLTPLFKINVLTNSLRMILSSIITNRHNTTKEQPYSYQAFLDFHVNQNSDK